MKTLKRLFFKDKTNNTYKQLLKEYKELQVKEKLLQSQLDELIEEKVTGQIKINELQKETARCENCERMNKQIQAYLNIKKDLLLETKTLNDEIKALSTTVSTKENLDINSSLPQPEKYFIMNNKYYIIDKERNLYTLSRCTKYEEFKEKMYNEIVKKHVPKENKLLNVIKAFVFGGLIGALGNLLIEFYSSVLNMKSTLSLVR